LQVLQAVTEAAGLEATQIGDDGSASGWKEKSTSKRVEQTVLEQTGRAEEDSSAESQDHEALRRQIVDRSMAIGAKDVETGGEGLEIEEDKEGKAGKMKEKGWTANEAEVNGKATGQKKEESGGKDEGTKGEEESFARRGEKTRTGIGAGNGMGRETGETGRRANATGELDEATVKNEDEAGRPEEIGRNYEQMGEEREGCSDKGAETRKTVMETSRQLAKRRIASRDGRKITGDDGADAARSHEVQRLEVASLPVHSLADLVDKEETFGRVMEARGWEVTGNGRRETLSRLAVGAGESSESIEAGGTPGGEEVADAGKVRNFLSLVMIAFWKRCVAMEKLATEEKPFRARIRLIKLSNCLQQQRAR
jgi:hypothetical protein